MAIRNWAALLAVSAFSACGTAATTADATAGDDVAADVAVDAAADGAVDATTTAREDLTWPVDKPGPYNVGYHMYSLTYAPGSDGATRTIGVAVWYPTNDQA